MTYKIYVWEPYLKQILEYFPDNEFTHAQVEAMCGIEVSSKLRKMSTRGFIEKYSKNGNKMSTNIWKISPYVVNKLKDITVINRKPHEGVSFKKPDFFYGKGAGDDSVF
jgi:hypothetical protein